MNELTKIDRKPKIVMLITRADIGGAQKHVEYLTTKLINRFDIEIIHGDGSYFEEALENLPIKLTRLNTLNSLNFPLAIFQLHRHLKKNPPDILHVHSTLASFYGRICGRLVNTKTIYTVHGWFFANPENTFIGWFGPIIEKCLVKFSVRTIFVSKFDLNLAKQKRCVDVSRSTYIPNSIPAKKIKKNPISKPPHPPLKTIFVGRLKWQKDPLLAIKAIQLCKQDIALTIYGDGPLKAELEHYISTNKLASQVTIISHIKNLNAEYTRHDCLLVTSNYEGMPLSILEAMSFSLPIISIDTCGISELIDNQYNGFLINSRSPNEIARSLDLIALQSVEQISELGENSLKKIEDEFSFTHFIQTTSDLYHNVLENE